MHLAARPTFFAYLPILLLTLLSLTAHSADDSTATEATETPAPEPAPERVNPSPYLQLQQDIEHQAGDTQVLQLSAEGVLFSLLFKESAIVRKGGILFFPDDQTHADWQIDIAPLRNALPSWGWATVSLPVLPPITPELPRRTLPALTQIRSQPEAATEQTPTTDAQPADTAVSEPKEPASTPPTEQPADSQPTPQSSRTRQQMLAHARAALGWMQQQGIKPIIIISSGSGATWASDFVVQMQESLQLPLLMIDARQSQDIKAPELLAQLASLKATTIDLYSTSPRNQSAAQKRLQAAQKAGVIYHQQPLPQGTRRTQGQTWLIKAVRGALDKRLLKNQAATKKPQPAPVIQEKPPGNQPKSSSPPPV